MKETIPSQTYLDVFNLIYSQAKNGVKTPLGLISLLINLDPEIPLEEIQTQTDTKTKDIEMEMQWS
ncbi:MAG: hypothetical protein ACOX6H_00470 [Christensenellales bacterium]